MKQRSRLAERWDSLRTSFGFLPAVAMLAGLVAAIMVPVLDRELGIDIPALSFDAQDSARSVLATIATATVSVAGLSFSVTVVAFTLASQQLSPRVLRSFRGDRLSQATLAALLGTFVYCLVLLVRLGVSAESAEPPNLSMTLAVIASIGSFMLFALFVAHIVQMLQPSSVVAAIHEDAQGVLSRRSFEEPPGAAAAARAACERLADPVPVRCRRPGYVTFVVAGSVLAAAEEAGALVEQVARVGTWVLPGETIARLRLPPDAGQSTEDDLTAVVRESFRLGRQRTMVEDVGFPIRQLADIALKALSPGINDPTTAQNAMEQLTTILVEFARRDRQPEILCDDGGEPRFILDLPDVGDLTREGFDQVRLGCGSHPGLAVRLMALLDHLRTVARSEGRPTEEIARQQRLLAAGLGRDALTGPEIAEFRERVAGI